MKLLFVCPDWFPYSAGLAQSCLEITQGLESLGHEVRIVVAKDKHLEDKGMTLVPIRYSFRLLGRNPISFSYWKQIKQSIKWADKICLFSYMYEMNARILLYKKLGLFNKPIIHFYRGSLEREGTQFLSWPTRMAKELWDVTLGRTLFTWSNKTISNSQPTLKYIQKKYGVSSKKLTYVPTGIQKKLYRQSTLKNKNIIFIGRLIENKGTAHFEDIMQSIPKEWTFTIIGDGPDTPNILSLAKKYSQINYVGKVSHAQVKKQLVASDLLVLPSYAEGSPRVVIEAAASGVPSVSFDVGDVRSFLPKNCVFPVRDIKKFTSQVQTLTYHPQQLKKHLSQKIYELKETNKLIEDELVR